MSYRQMISTTAVLGALLMFAVTARAGVSPLMESVSVDLATKDATFTIDFPHPPDFYTVDKYGRPADSFQVEVSANPLGSDPLANLTSIIRGDEIHLDHAIPIRNASPPDLTDPASGGWGTIRGTVPFTVTNDDLSFTVPLAMLGVPDGRFAYRSFTLQSGMLTAESQGESVPLPTALAAAMVMVGIGLAFASIKAIVQWRIRRLSQVLLPWGVRVA